MLDTKHYPNGSPEAYAEDKKRHRNVDKYDNIYLFPHWRAYDAYTAGKTIRSVDVRHTDPGARIRFDAPYYAECSGDGWIGIRAGVVFTYGRASFTTFDAAWEEFWE